MAPISIKTEFTITPQDVNDCLAFALQVEQSQRQFGSGMYRKRAHVVADTLEGKISEVAAQQFFAQFGLNIVLDFAFYRPNETDQGHDVWAVREGDSLWRTSFRLDIKGALAPDLWTFIA